MFGPGFLRMGDESGCGVRVVAVHSPPGLISMSGVGTRGNVKGCAHKCGNRWPETDGFELIRRIRQSHDLQKTVIIKNRKEQTPDNNVVLDLKHKDKGG